MPLKCYYKPNRSTARTFNARAAARTMCAAIENGATQEQIEEQAEELGCWTDRSDKECERKRRAAVAIAQELIAGNNQTLAAAEAALSAIGIGIRIALGILNIVPGGAAASRALLTLQRVTLTQITRNVSARRAANDELFLRVANL